MLQILTILQVSDLLPGITVYGMLERQLCSRTNKFKTSTKEFPWPGTLFHVVLVTSCQMIPALQLVLNHKLYLPFEDKTPH